MIVAPIIMPIHTTHIRDCIVQDGVRYCEQSNMTQKDIGVVCLVAFLALVWMFFWIWISERSIFVALGGAVGLPLLLGSLYLIFF